MRQRLALGGFFRFRHYAMGVLVEEQVAPNGWTRWGARDFLNLAFRPKNFPASQDLWIGIIDGPASGVTLSRDDETGHVGDPGPPFDGHPGWEEDLVSERLSASWSTVFIGPNSTTAKEGTHAPNLFDVQGAGKIAGALISKAEDPKPSPFSFTPEDIYCTALLAADIDVTAASELEVTYFVQLFNTDSFNPTFTSVQADDTTLTAS